MFKVEKYLRVVYGKSVALNSTKYPYQIDLFMLTQNKIEGNKFEKCFSFCISVDDMNRELGCTLSCMPNQGLIKFISRLH